jgi:AcrR family transcriptional regulator
MEGNKVLCGHVFKGTLYYHFASKEEMLVVLVRGALGEAGARAEGALEAGVPPTEVLRSFLIELAQWSERNRHLVRPPLTLTLGGGPQPGEAREGQASFRQVTAHILAAAQAAGQVRSDMEAIELAQMLAVLYLTALMAGLAEAATEVSLEARMERSFRLFLEGAQATGGSHG